MLFAPLANLPKGLQHEEYDVVTLLACEIFIPFSGDYMLRRMVRGVLVSIDKRPISQLEY